MKLKFKELDKDGSGTIRLFPEEPEDMWHAYNLIAIGDLVKAGTIRRVERETHTGSSSSERVRIMLTIDIQKIDFDSQMGVLRLSGKNVSENKYVKLGAFHTLDLEMNREFSITKNYWDMIALERVASSCDPSQQADVASIILVEGLAHVCLITSTMTIVRQRIEMPIPRKRKGSVTAHDKGLQRFFEAVMQSLLRHINFEVVKAVIVASPGFVKDQFFEYIMLEAQRQDLKVLLENKEKFILTHSSSGHKHALKEIFSDPAVASKLENTKSLKEVRALQEFYDMLKIEPDRAFYGISHILMANEQHAIQTLLLTDELFRAADIKTRRKYVELVESVKGHSGEIFVFSSLHVSGEQLGQLGGIAAILRFPIPEIEENDKEESENGEMHHSAEEDDE